MDVIHMEEVEGHKYALILVDIFSRRGPDGHTVAEPEASHCGKGAEEARHTSRHGETY